MNLNVLQRAVAIACGLAVAAFAAHNANAAITLAADYHLGESDPSGVLGNVSTGAVDSSGNGFNLNTVTGTPTYAAGDAAIRSSLSLAFNGSSFLQGPTVSNATENFGIELFAKTSNLSQSTALAVNGSGCCSGFGIFMSGGQYFGLYGGVNVADIGTVSTNAFQGLAVVNVGGATETFLNGVLTSSVNIGDPHPANGPICCSPPLNMTIGSDGTHNFTGDIDEVRVFTFAPGAFSPSDLVIPEPASALLLGSGIIYLIGAARRRRKA